MSTKTIRKAAPAQKQRVDDFLKRLPSMRSKVTPVAKDSWREIIGSAPGDELDEEAARLGAEWRARMNKSRQG